MKTLYVLPACALLLAGCGNKAPETKEVSAPETPPAIQKECYAYITASDTVTLEISVNDGQVAGDLIYKLKEKDRNTGTIAGEMKGDTLYGEYAFFSEGVESAREVVFLKNGDTMTEGYGLVREEGDRQVMSRAQAPDFSNGIILKKGSCSGK